MSVLPYLFLLVQLLHFAAAGSNVKRLTDTNFNRQLAFNKNLLVMFFIPWSGQCQKSRPHFGHAAAILAASHIPVTLGKMDCSGKGRNTCNAKKIQHPYPVFHFYRNGEFVKEYTGSRDSGSLVKFMRVQVFPDPVEIKTLQEFKEFLQKQDDVIVVGFFEEESKLRRMFFRVAEEMKESIIFVHSSNEKLLIKQGVNNGIVIFRPKQLHNPYEPDRILFTGRAVIGEIKNFIIRNFHGLVGHRTPLNRRDFPNPIIIVYHTIDYHAVGKELNYWRYRLLKIAHKYAKDVKIVTSAIDDFPEEVSTLNTDNLTPTSPLVIGYDLENQKYVMTDNFTTQNFENFVQNFVNRNLTSYYKSSPSRPNDGLVINAVTQTFNSTVLHNDKDTLLDLHAPWSLKSQKFFPVFREVAQLLEDDNLAFVRMDITQNEVPGIFKDKELPNVFWLGRNEKKRPVMYERGRNVEQLLKFVAKQATMELKSFDRYGNLREERDEL